MSDIDKMSTYDIKQYLERRAQREYAAQREKERQVEKEFRSRKKELDIFQASDYCGMSYGRYSFYYGYERTYCPEHGNDKDQCCDKWEWAFVAYIDHIEEMRLPTSELWYIQDATIVWYLLSGIGQFMDQKAVD